MNMNTIALKLVRMYQKYISPYKGFKCAHGVHIAGSISCSGYAVKVLKEKSFGQAYSAIRQRLKCCHEVNLLFNGGASMRHFAKDQAGFVDCDCGGADCAPDCGSMDCAPDCNGCDIFSADHSHFGSCGSIFGSSGSSVIDAGDVLDLAEDFIPERGGEKKGNHKKIDNSQPGFVLVYATDNEDRYIYRNKQKSQWFLVNSPEELNTEKARELSREEAQAWLLKASA